MDSYLVGSQSVLKVLASASSASQGVLSRMSYRSCVFWENWVALVITEVRFRVSLVTYGPSMMVWGQSLRNPSVIVLFYDDTVFSRHGWRFGPLGPKN
jgi:hypothetical protein